MRLRRARAVCDLRARGAGGCGRGVSKPTLRLALGDQLSANLSSLSDLNADTDLVLMAEVGEEAGYVRHHKQKIALIFAAMRKFAAGLEGQGAQVRYTRLDDPDNSHSLEGEVARALESAGEFDRVVVTEPGEWRLAEIMDGWSDRFGCPVEVRTDDRFVCTREEFADWAKGRKALRMEYFYREMRRKTGLLMEGDDPVGGQWNYDADNRKRLPKDFIPPKRRRFEPDADTQAVIDLVAERFSNHFGDLDGFDWAVDAEGAQAALEHFIADALPQFGDYQDAMAKDQAFLMHGLVSAYLNIGLLDPLEVCKAAEAAYHDDHAPLNAVEGFIRQILGWREYVRGLYWLKMPDYKALNALDAQRPLPDFYWSGETDMRCVADVVAVTRRHAYAHHIQRLMVTGNFALLAGISPDAVNDWYLSVYADAFEWVELPNTHGMAIYADGGIMASKPYAASGAYIDRMSDYCRDCAYDVKTKTGEGACPFNYLYWNFLIENEDALSNNPRLGMPYRNLAKMSADKRQAITTDAAAFLKSIGIDNQDKAA
ncbi:MAG: cryptochrome/photolyase family protein [Maricaulaceae bacterium]